MIFFIVPSEAEAIDVGTFEVYKEVRVCKFQQGETGLIANSSEKVGRVKKVRKSGPSEKVCKLKQNETETGLIANSTEFFCFVFCNKQRSRSSYHSHSCHWFGLVWFLTADFFRDNYVS